jgi:predicted NAD-dependent protein-ADP-ribosyltransferase YbiA (DUF1768 family)
MAETPAVINFYSTTGEYGCFSNFSRHAIHLAGNAGRRASIFSKRRSSEAPSMKRPSGCARSPARRPVWADHASCRCAETGRA